MLKVKLTYLQTYLSFSLGGFTLTVACVAGCSSPSNGSPVSGGTCTTNGSCASGGNVGVGGNTSSSNGGSTGAGGSTTRAGSGGNLGSNNTGGHGSGTGGVGASSVGASSGTGGVAGSVTGGSAATGGTGSGAVGTAGGTGSSSGGSMGVGGLAATGGAAGGSGGYTGGGSGVGGSVTGGSAATGGAGGGSSNGGVACAGYPVWNSEVTYDVAGQLVEYNCKLYQNQGYAYDINPETNNGQYYQWLLMGSCSESGCAMGEGPWIACGNYDKWTTGAYEVYNDVWGSGAGTQCITAWDGSHWTAESTQPATSGVKSYPNSGFVNVGKTISSLTTFSSSFDITVPTNGDWEATYDIWVPTEIMVWMYTLGNVGPIASSWDSTGNPIPSATDVTVGGHIWNVYRQNGGTNVISFVRTTNITTATVRHSRARQLGENARLDSGRNHWGGSVRLRDQRHGQRCN